MTSPSEVTGRVKWDPGPITVNSVTCTERQGNGVQSENRLVHSRDPSSTLPVFHIADGGQAP